MLRSDWVRVSRAPGLQGSFSVGVSDLSWCLVDLLRLFSQTLFDGMWHQLKLLVQPQQVTGFLDDQRKQDASLGPVEPIYINGWTQVSKRRRTDVTVPVSAAAVVLGVHQRMG